MLLLLLYAEMHIGLVPVFIEKRSMILSDSIITSSDNLYFLSTYRHALIF